MCRAIPKSVRRRSQAKLPIDFSAEFPKKPHTERPYAASCMLLVFGGWRRGIARCSSHDIDVAYSVPLCPREVKQQSSGYYIQQSVWVLASVLCRRVETLHVNVRLWQRRIILVWRRLRHRNRRRYRVCRTKTEHYLCKRLFEQASIACGWFVGGVQSVRSSVIAFFSSTQHNNTTCKHKHHTYYIYIASRSIICHHHFVASFSGSLRQNSVWVRDCDYCRPRTILICCNRRLGGHYIHLRIRRPCFCVINITLKHFFAMVGNMDPSNSRIQRTIRQE